VLGWRGGGHCSSPAPIPESADKVAAWARWRKAGKDWEPWFVSDGNDFQIVRFTNWFMAHNGSLFQGPGK